MDLFQKKSVNDNTIINKCNPKKSESSINDVTSKLENNDILSKVFFLYIIWYI